MNNSILNQWQSFSWPFRRAMLHLSVAYTRGLIIRLEEDESNCLVDDVDCMMFMGGEL